MRTIGRLAKRLGLCLGFMLCLTLVSAAGAGAQTGSGSGSGSGSGTGGGTTTTVATGVTTPVVQPNLAVTGEQTAIPLAAAAGLVIVVMGTRQLRRRANN